MQFPPIILSDLALLILLVTLSSLIILQITLPVYGLTNFLINKKKLRDITILNFLLFMLILAFISIQYVLSS